MTADVQLSCNRTHPTDTQSTSDKALVGAPVLLLTR